MIRVESPRGSSNAMKTAEDGPRVKIMGTLKIKTIKWVDLQIGGTERDTTTLIACGPPET